MAIGAPYQPLANIRPGPAGQLGLPKPGTTFRNVRAAKPKPAAPLASPMAPPATPAGITQNYYQAPSAPSMPSFGAPAPPQFFMGGGGGGAGGGSGVPAAAPPPGAGGGALSGLSAAIQQRSGPAPGWADDPALMATADQLGTRTPPMAMGILSQIVNQRGRLY
jgi:hypothetical protein